MTANRNQFIPNDTEEQRGAWVYRAREEHRDNVDFWYADNPELGKAWKVFAAARDAIAEKAAGAVS